MTGGDFWVDGFGMSHANANPSPVPLDDGDMVDAIDAARILDVHAEVFRQVWRYRPGFPVAFAVQRGAGGERWSRRAIECWLEERRA